MSTPNPPLGYALEQLPEFLWPTATRTNIVERPANGVDIAVVTPQQPSAIQVHDRQLFTEPVEAHELTHVFQRSRNQAVVNDLADAQSHLLTADGNAQRQAYDYGGLAGLMAARIHGKTIADYGPEAQAQMVSDYQRLTQQAITQGNERQLDAVNAAYGPFVHQIANLPGKNDSMTTMTQRDLTPDAPGLPPSTETGIMEPNPLIGGAARVLPPAGYRLER